MTIETRPGEPGFSDRNFDARDEIEGVEREARSDPIVIRNIRTGNPTDPGDVALIRHPVTGKFKRNSPPPLSAEEQARVVTTLRDAMESNAVRYPQLAQHMVNNPDDIWLLPEITLMLDDRPDPIVNDFVGEALDALSTTTEDIDNYNQNFRTKKTQEVFWNDVGAKYEDEGIRDLLLHQLAQLDIDGANRVAALAVTWADNHDMDEEENQMQLLLNIHSWSFSEDQAEMDIEHGGVWTDLAQKLEAAKEWVVSSVADPLMTKIDSALSSPEEAARRRHLTFGQKFAYMLGARPPSSAGEWGWWNVISGAADAWTEIGLDPINVVAGIGIGVKAAKSVPLAAKATKLGRVRMAARANLPRFFTGGTKRVRGGRYARMAYAFKAKDADKLLDLTVKNGTAAEALKLIKAGNQSKFARHFPQWGRMPDEMFDSIKASVESPEEFIQMLKSGAIDEVTNSGLKLAEAELLANDAMEEALKHIDDTPVSAPDEILAFGDDIAFHGTTATEADKIMETGKLTKGGLWNADNYKNAVGHARDAARHHKGAEPVVIAVKKSDLPTPHQRGLETRGAVMQIQPEGGGIGARVPVQARIRVDTTEDLVSKARKGAATSGRRPQNFDELKQTLRGEELADETADSILELSQPARTRPTLPELLKDENIPRDLRIAAAQAKLKLNVLNGEVRTPFIISDIPTGPNKIFRWRDRFQGEGRAAAATRRFLAKSTQGRPPDTINLFKTRQATVDIENLLLHFGLREEKIDSLLTKFLRLDRGARQDFFIDEVIGSIGDELGIPAFRHQIVQMYKKTRAAKFSASGTDVYIDALTGKSRRMPILASQMNPNMPIPLEELDQVFRRTNSLKNRSKYAKALGWNGRGLGKTNERRLELVRKLRTQLGDEAQGMSDEDLWTMAYSAVNPGAGLDGRGWLAATALPLAGSGFNQLHRFFTKAMLVGRPIQWMWRVALLEEPIRAHLYNLPSIYSNPLQYFGAAREAYYIENAARWAKGNADIARDVYATITSSGNRDTILKNLTDNGLLKDIFPSGADDLTLPQIKRGISRFITDATYGRTRVTKLNPIKKVGWATRRRAYKVSQAEKALTKRGIQPGFTFAKDTDINQKWVSGMLGEAIGDSDPRSYTWTGGHMTNTEATHHGRVWGGSIIGLVEDPLARIAIRRRASALRGQPEDLADEIINSSSWDLIKHDLQLRFADVDDELVLAERYMDEVIGPEVDYLFAPFYDDLGPQGAADILDDLVNTRRIETTVYGSDIKWDLRTANYAGAQRAVGDFTAAMRNNPNAAIPRELAGETLDPRFMSQDDPNFVTKISDAILQTFGEGATQVLNRRPAWLKEYDRWYDNYTKLDVPEDIASSLAREHANEMVNFVFFNMDQAPHYARKLNQFIPFFGATYEVMSTWAYKLPAAAGGYWPVGIAEFTRKITRLMDGLVNTGLVTREQQDDGSVTHTLNLVPPDSSAATNKELGRFLQGAGFKAVNTLDQTIRTVLDLGGLLDAARDDDGNIISMRDQGYRLSTGHPLNIEDYGTLSFAQANLGVNPATNLILSLAGRSLGAGAPGRLATEEGGETLGDFIERAEVEPNDLIRYNREIFIDTEGLPEKYGYETGSDLYNALLAGVIDPFEIDLPEGIALNLPGSSFWDGFVADTFQPFGDVDSLTEFGINFLPGTLRWGLAGIALQNEPSDEFWQDNEVGGRFGGLLPEINQAQVASQINEAFMYLEAHDIVAGKGPFARIQAKQERREEAIKAGNNSLANKLEKEIRLDTQAFLSRAQKVAAESLILRSVTGQFLPTSPGHVRKEQELIQQFWDTREYADNLKIRQGGQAFQNFKSVEEMDNYYEQLAAWLQDPTGDRARATFRQNYPQLFAYLTPKTFYKEPVPDIDNYQEYQEQIESGQREPAPLQVTMWRHRSSAIQADFYNKYIARFGNDPTEAAANALNERADWNELNEERNRAYQSLEMWDDMHGSVYDTWRKENRASDDPAEDQIIDTLNTVRDNLKIVLELEDTFDVELDLQGIDGLNTALKASIAEISQAIRDYETFTEGRGRRNAYEEAINQYFEEVYVPYQEEISALYDQLPEVADSERQSIIYERIKILKNEHANSVIFLNENTDAPFPNPLEYSWNGKSEEERAVKVKQWLTRPLMWTDQDQTGRIIERAPHMAKYLPINDEDFDIYRQYTLAKVELDEMFEFNEITRTERNKVLEKMDEELRRQLYNMGRKEEVEFMDMTPYEKLELSGELPPILGIFSEQAGWYNQALRAAEQSAGTVEGRRLVEPLFNRVRQAFGTDPTMREALMSLGEVLQDEDSMDQFLPWLFFGYTGEI